MAGRGSFLAALAIFFVDFCGYCSYHSLSTSFRGSMTTELRAFTKNKSAKVDYAAALRCIGQDLERRGLKTFDIRFDGREFDALCGYQEPPAATPVELKYRLNDIVELDQAGEKNRGKMAPAKDFLNQPQVFRTIGGFLDRNEARLVRLANNDRRANQATFVVEYINRDGESIVDDRAGAAIYDMCVAMYKLRGKLTGTSGRRG